MVWHSHSSQPAKYFGAQNCEVARIGAIGE